MIDIVIVAYNPDVELINKNIKRALDSRYVNKVIVVDNSNSSNNFNCNNNSFSYIPLFENKGIATAQNIGIKKSLSDKKSAVVILFDQDSIISKLLLEQLYDDYLLCKKRNIIVGAIGPTMIDSFSNKTEHPKFFKEIVKKRLLQVDKIIASGQLLDKEFIQYIGLMDEELFIDGVDSEWCWRANSKNYKILLSVNAKMIHTVGESIIKLPFLSLRVATPIRMYYQYRNYFLLFNKKHTPLYWKIRVGIAYVLKLFIFTMFVSDKKERLFFIKKGIKDGIIGKRGRIDS
ncbi:glycosyltransferase [Photobacterium toruni]|uniref:glycosyltransferase n=1 Tax=Photobacterium toruni TaxID=1935446 RepID=UPI00210F829A|nr:glycosyltransferase [Photobacterium toruni]